jgi:hypothetical protein
MTITNVLLYLALIGFIVHRRMQGKPVQSAKKLLVLPVILTIIGGQDLSHATLNSVDEVVVVLGSTLSLGLGAVRGFTDKVSVRDGRPWVRWSGASLAIFSASLVSKLVIDVVGVAAGGTTAGVTSSLLLAFGLMTLGEALVILYRIQSSLPHLAGGGHGARRP